MKAQQRTVPDGVVQTLIRYPVKSMQGERLSRATIDHRGIDGDRMWAVYTADGGIGSGKTTRRFRRLGGLLAFTSWMNGLGPVVRFPDGSTHDAENPVTAELLGDALHRPVTLCAETTTPHHDESPIHVITSATLRNLELLLGEPVDERRIRANVVLDVSGTGFVEDAWKGRELCIGDEVVLRLGAGMPRCVMVGLAQPGVSHDPRVLATIVQHNRGELGLQAEVALGGTIRQGDHAYVR